MIESHILFSVPLYQTFLPIFLFQYLYFRATRSLEVEVVFLRLVLSFFILFLRVLLFFCLPGASRPFTFGIDFRSYTSLGIPIEIKDIMYPSHLLILRLFVFESSFCLCIFILMIHTASLTGSRIDIYRGVSFGQWEVVMV